MKKLAFTLLEVLIALGLTLLILSFLLGSYFYIERSNLEWSSVEEEIFQERYIRHRLEEVFGTIKQIDQNQELFFTVDGGPVLPGTSSFVFSYDNGMLFDNPALSGSVIGRLYVDRQGNLTLLTWPSRSDWREGQLPPLHREVLMSQVANAQFDFFQVPTSKVNEEPIKGQWQKVWPKDLKYGPGIIHMTLQLVNGHTVSFNFLIPAIISIIRESAT